MFDGIERAPLYFISLFHGIVTAYLVYIFTDLEISETYFVIFVLFCCTINIIIVRGMISLPYVCKYISGKYVTAMLPRSHKKFSLYEEKTLAASTSLRRIVDFNPDAVLVRPGLTYFGLCLCASLASTYLLSCAYQHDWAFRFLANQIGWRKTYSRSIVQHFLENNCVTKDYPSDECHLDEYIQVWWKSNNLIIAGFLSDEPKAYRGKQYLQLTNSCHLVLYNGLLKYPDGKIKFEVGVTSFVDINDPAVQAIQIVHNSNPCELATRQ